MLSTDTLVIPIYLAGYDPDWVYRESTPSARVVMPPPKPEVKGRYHNRIRAGDTFNETRLSMTDQWSALRYDRKQGRWLCKNHYGGTHYYSSAELHEMTRNQKTANAK